MDRDDIIAAQLPTLWAEIARSRALTIARTRPCPLCGVRQFDRLHTGEWIADPAAPDGYWDQITPRWPHACQPRPSWWARLRARLCPGHR